MISRRPNTRASTENRPGPAPMMARSIVNAKISAGFESNKFGVEAGSQESATPTAPSPTTTPANGVRKPTKHRPPEARADKPRDHVTSVGFGSPR
jgi:hypothetical protein